MNRFFIYKEYGAKYEMMIKDVSLVNQAMPQWEAYQKGLEALASILDSAKNAEERSNKALTVGDLLVKVSSQSLAKVIMHAHLLDSLFREFAGTLFYSQSFSNPRRYQIVRTRTWKSTAFLQECER